ncbi:MAG: apolipoprotein N-acyltransferase [Rickettsiales bacterium]|jgi:apolipoprotein N-acyltransferase|nr:apolipoprotein N-acyltransferase [Rickettsiales bacterium]
MKIYVNYNDKRWKKHKVNFAKIARIAAGPTSKDSEVSIILTNDTEIRALNKQYRGFDKPTNVLSFETGDDVLLGDIYISFDTVMREAMKNKKFFKSHAAHMAAHGVLHLLGYDHIKDSDAQKMENLEIKVLKKLGIGDPYVEGEICHNKRMQYLLYFALGGVSSLGYAPFNLWWAALIGIGGAYYLTVRDSDNGCENKLRKALLRILPFGAAYAIGMFWWIVNSIFVVPELARQFAVWTAPAILGIGLLGGIIFAVPFVSILCMRLKHAHRPFLFACAWTMVLWLREWLATGFPWNPVANIAMPFPMLANSMSLWGALGLTFAIVGLTTSVVEIIGSRKARNVCVPVVVFAALIISGMIFGYKNIKDSAYASGDSSPVIRIVQPADSAEDKATHSLDQAAANAERNIQSLIRLATENPARHDLVVFPETAYPYLITNDEMPMSQILKKPIVIGATTYDDGRFYNSLVIAGEDGRIGEIYSKSHLVPFGEYRPFGDIIPTPGQLTPGGGAEILRVAYGAGTIDFAPAICYEIIFSNSLILRGSAEPQVIINITNDTWFGKTPGSYQHLDMVRRYAIESGLPVVRANYSGISAFVNADGRVASSLPIGVAGSLDRQVGGGHMTIYRMIGRDWWMFIILLFSAACIFAVRRK